MGHAFGVVIRASSRSESGGFPGCGGLKSVWWIYYPEASHTKPGLIVIGGGLWPAISHQRAIAPWKDH